jgi:hypothetical protein
MNSCWLGNPEHNINTQVAYASLVCGFNTLFSLNSGMSPVQKFQHMIIERLNPNA